MGVHRMTVSPHPIGRSFARRSTTPRSSLPPTGICQSEPELRDLSSKKNLMILAILFMFCDPGGESVRNFCTLFNTSPCSVLVASVHLHCRAEAHHPPRSKTHSCWPTVARRRGVLAPGANRIHVVHSFFHPHLGEKMGARLLSEMRRRGLDCHGATLAPARIFEQILYRIQALRILRL